MIAFVDTDSESSPSSAPWNAARGETLIQPPVQPGAMSDNPWTDRIVGERMAVDQEFSTQIEASQFSNQQWSLIMTATEFEIEHPDDPDRAQLVANTDKIDGIIPELDNVQSGMGAMAGGGGGADRGSSSSSGGVFDSIMGHSVSGATAVPRRTNNGRRPNNSRRSTPRNSSHTSSRRGSGKRFGGRLPTASDTRRLSHCRISSTTHRPRRQSPA